MPASNWLHRAVVPAVWAAAEATWVCLWARPFFGVGLEPSADFQLPYPLVLAAMLAGTLLGAWLAPVGLVLRARAALVAPLVVGGVVGVAMLICSTGTVGEVSASGWVVAVVVWGRGLWIGLDEPAFAHLVRSAGLGAFAFIGLFLAQALDDPTFNAASGSAAWLFVVFLAGTAGILALVRERELERRVLARPGAPPSLAWLAVLGLPMVAVAGGALLLAVVAGPVGGPVGDGVGAAASGARDGVMAVAEAIGSLFSGESGQNYVPTQDRVPVFDPAPPPPSEEGGSGALQAVLLVVLYVLLALPLLALLAFLVVKLRKLKLPGGLRRDARPGPRPADEETTSVFSARSFFGRFFGFFGRLFRGRSGGSGVGAGGEGHRWSTLPPAPPVRQQYREVLVAAGARGVGRRPPETVLEFEARLGERCDEAGVGPELRLLTDLYSNVRYGERAVEADAPLVAEAAAAARAVISALDPPPAQGRSG